MRVLLTSGATREPIDGVRFISNFSSGRTGAVIADYFASRGHSVTYACGPGAARPTRSCELREFGSFADLDSLLRSELAAHRHDAMIHLAAVSDYSVDRVEVEGREFRPDPELKLSSDPERVTLHLKRNFKIVHRLGEYAGGRPPFLVAFKLTCSASHEQRQHAVQRLLQDECVRLVVHNDLGEISRWSHPFTLYSRDAEPIQLESVASLAAALEENIGRSL